MPQQPTLQQTLDPLGIMQPVQEETAQDKLRRTLQLQQSGEATPQDMREAGIRLRPAGRSSEEDTKLRVMTTQFDPAAPARKNPLPGIAVTPQGQRPASDPQHAAIPAMKPGWGEAAVTGGLPYAPNPLGMILGATAGVAAHKLFNVDRGRMWGEMAGTGVGMFPQIGRKLLPWAAGSNKLIGTAAAAVPMALGALGGEIGQEISDPQEVTMGRVMTPLALMLMGGLRGSQMARRVGGLNGENITSDTLPGVIFRSGSKDLGTFVSPTGTAGLQATPPPFEAFQDVVTKGREYVGAKAASAPVEIALGQQIRQIPNAPNIKGTSDIARYVTDGLGRLRLALAGRYGMSMEEASKAAAYTATYPELEKIVLTAPTRTLMVFKLWHSPSYLPQNADSQSSEASGGVGTSAKAVTAGLGGDCGRDATNAAFKSFKSSDHRPCDPAAYTTHPRQRGTPTNSCTQTRTPHTAPRMPA